MRKRARRHRPTLLAGALAVAGACSEADSSAAAIRDAHISTVGDAAVDGSAGDDDATGPAELCWIEPSQRAICPGDCVMLTLRVAESLPDYTTTWSHGLGSEPAPRVCPTVSTTYQVEVSERYDTPSEFAPQLRSGLASSTITVHDDCIDGKPPMPAARVGCSLRIPVERPTHGTPLLSGVTSLDAQGNLYLAATLQGRAQLGGRTLGNIDTGVRSNQDVLLAKLDADCQLVWSRLHEGHNPALMLIDLAVHADGNIAVLSEERRFDALGKSYRHLQLARLDTNGKLLWAQHEPEDVLGGASAAEGSLAFASDGSLAAIGLRSRCDNYGLTLPEQQLCVLRMDASGAPTWTLWSDALALTLAFGAQDKLLLVAEAGPSGLTVTGHKGRQPVAGPAMVAGVVSPAGVVSWLRAQPATSDASSPRGTFAKMGKPLMVWTETVPGMGVRSQFWRLSPQGDMPELAGHDFEPLLSTIKIAPMANEQLATLSSASAADGTSRTLLRSFSATGQQLTSRDVSCGAHSQAGGLSVRSDGAMAFTVEERDATGALSALLVHRLPGAEERRGSPH